MSKKKPAFACNRYPNCPERDDLVSQVLEPADPEEGFGPVTTYSRISVVGPCEKFCCLEEDEDRDQPTVRPVMCIIGGRVVDIGS